MAKLIVRLAVTLLMVSPFHLKATAQSTADGAATGPTTGTRGSKGEEALEEIIVTAQRREEILSKTPVSVQAFTSEELAQANIVSEDDLQTITPGLEVRSQRNGDELNYSLRGQSQDQFSGTRPGVLPYFNEVQIAGQLSSSALYDLQSIQVLKGPQGTLFGRSATGGAVLYTTNKPTNDWTGEISALGGNYNQQQYQGVIGGPLIADTLLARVAFYDYRRDGFQTDVANESNIGGVKRYGVRGSLTANIANDLGNTIVVDYYHGSGQSTVAAIHGILPLTGGLPPGVPTTLLYAGTATPLATTTGECTMQAFVGLPSCTTTGGPLPAIASYYSSYFSQPKHPAIGLTGYLATQLARGPYAVDVDDPYLAQQNLLASDTLTYKITPDLLVKNIVGLGRLRLMDFSDADGTPYGIETLVNSNPVDATHDNTDQYSEEIQLQGTAFGERFNYTSGFYFAHEKEDNLYQQQFFDILFGGAQQVNAYTTTSQTYAGYGQGTYKINDRGLSATLGLRYTSETLTLTTLPNDSARVALGPVAPPGYSYEQSQTYGRPSYTLGLEDQLTDQLLVYGVTRLAYKSGGFNGPLPPRVGNAAQGGDAFGAESVQDIELGTKYAGVIGTLPAQVSLDYYHSWDKNAQRVNYAVVDGQPTNFTVNVPEAQVDGIEFDGRVRPLGWLTLGTNFAYTHARYTQGNVSLFGTVTNYDQVTDTPLLSGAGFVEVAFPIIGDSISGTLHGDVYAQDKTQTSYTSLNDYGSTTPGYAITDFRFVLNSKANWSITANLKNAFNRIYYTGGGALGPINQINTLNPGQPRTFTVQARYRFGSGAK